MSKTKQRRTKENYDEDGFRKPRLSKIKEEKQKKRERNFDNALRSKNIDKLTEYDDE